MTTDFILGTAGHIDHGKTSLIRALTGVDTDRLPEEKRRGITIELGFAELMLGEHRLGVVDVPGHERFVRNMLAGATGMDLALLVIAADDSIKPQTREHLEILKLLELEAGVIALTKADLVEPEWLELVTEEIRATVAGTFLETAPIIPTSVVTGRGLPELCQRLREAADLVANGGRLRRVEAPFRLPIDRTFTIAGHGTVVTGSVTSGKARLGDELSIEPGGLRVRVRGLQNHDRAVEFVQRGQRAAINLAGVHHDQIRRGQELCSPGHLVPSRLLTAQLTLLTDAPRPLKDRARVRLHVGTAELLASVRFLDRGFLEPGATAPAQLFLSEPGATVWGQPFVIRSESPVQTIGGGHVLDPQAERLRRPDESTLRMIAELSSDDPNTRAGAALYFAGFRPWEPQDLVRTAGVTDVNAATAFLRARGDLVEIAVSPSRSRQLHRLTLDRLCRRIEAVLLKLHARYPLRSWMERSLVTHAVARLADETIVRTALEQLQRLGRVTLSDRGVALAGQGPKLSQNEQKLLTQFVATFRSAGIQPPSIKELQQQTPKHQDAVPQLLALAAANGELVAISPEFYLHAEVERELRQRLAAELSRQGGLTMSQIRDLLGTTRKYALPYCEFLDRVGFTRRQDDLRVLGDKAGSCADQTSGATP